MNITRISRQKLIEKHIRWEERYTDRTLFLKEQFEDVVGPGSYFRFEGESDEGDHYYCILGPAKIHHPIAKFFAGVRKLPATYSAGGKYFDSLDGASVYAKETWGVPRPQALKPYNASKLFKLKDKIDVWKAKREQENGESEHE